MAEYDRPPATERTGGTGNTAIVAIVVIILLAVIAFFIFLRPGDAPLEREDGPDVELEITPPDEALPEPGGDGGGGDGDLDAAPNPAT